jgi:hypothetical protein
MIRLVLGAVLLVTACAGAPPAADPTPVAAPTAAATPQATSVPPPSATPPERATKPPEASATAASPAGSPSPAQLTIEPTAIIPANAGGTSINMVAFGDDVWATVMGGLLRIDARTGEAATVVHPEPVSQSRYLSASSDWIWVADFYNQVVHRVDPATGEITATTEVPGEPRTVLIGDDVIWAPMNGGSTYRIDPDTMKIVGEPVPHQASAYGLGSLWVGKEPTGPVLRVDPETAEVLAEIAIPADGSGCRVAGSFPDGVWGWCGLVSNRHVVTRLDPDADTVVGSVDLGGATSSSSGVLATDDEAWFPLIATGPGQSGRLVRVNLETNEVDRVLDGGPNFDVNELVIAGDALWASMEGPQEIWRIPLEQIGASR